LTHDFSHGYNMTSARCPSVTPNIKLLCAGAMEISYQKESKIMLKAIAGKLVPSATVLALPAVCCGQAYARALVTPSSPPPSFIVQGVNSSGTVRVNNYANIEFLLNVAASVVEIGGIAWGLLCIYQGIKDPARRRGRIVLGLFLIAVGLSAPGLVNYMTA